MNEHNFHQLKMQVLRRLHQGLQRAQQHFQRDFLIPSINYKLRGVKAGVAYLQRNEIRLNPILLQENPNTFIQQVVWHELAHLLSFQLYGRVKPHGIEWQKIMTEIFKLPAETCHQFDTARTQGKTFFYHCNCRTHQLSLRRHNKIQRKEAEYFCLQCKGKLIKD